MRNISKNIGKLLLGVAIPLGASAITLTSCDDFLDQKPMGQIVFENYWEDRADVESVVYSCYSGLLDENLMKRLFIWGELRSDNVIYAKSANDINIQQIIEENILETNPNVTWTPFYQVINRCNTVIEFAPLVAERDPNYTESDLAAHIAEVTWIRSLCYFYLVRTFRDIPYVTKPSLTDDDIDKDYRIPLTDFKTLLRQLVTDLEAVQGDAMRFYPPMSGGYTRADNPYNSSRVTVCAFYALLADINLWLGEYQAAADYAQRVIDFKANVYREVHEESPNSVRGVRLYNDKYPLYTEAQSGSNTCGYAYQANFGTGNSLESIFEIYDHDQSKENPITQTFIYSQQDANKRALCNVNPDLVSGAFTDANKYFKYTDCRFCEYFPVPVPESGIEIYKFQYYMASFTLPTQAGNTPSVSYSISTYSNKGNLNWPIYRLPDLMLVKAEALVELGGEENLKEAFEIVSANYNRANNLNDGNANCLKAEKYPDQEAMRQLVREERHRELMFEGKRWFDLVRYALHDGNNQDLINTVLPKQQKNANRIRIQLQSPNALFWPYAEREIDMNPDNIKQNPAYITNETSKK